MDCSCMLIKFSNFPSWITSEYSIVVLWLWAHAVQQLICYCSNLLPHPIMVSMFKVSVAKYQKVVYSICVITSNTVLFSRAWWVLARFRECTVATPAEVSCRTDRVHSGMTCMWCTSDVYVVCDVPAVYYPAMKEVVLKQCCSYGTNLFRCIRWGV